MSHSWPGASRFDTPKWCVTSLRELTTVLYCPSQCNCDHPKTTYRYRLTDFGFSKPFEEDEEQESSQRSGSEGYTAPELANRQIPGQYSEKTDIWAFGCLLFELASTKRRPAFKYDYHGVMYSKNPQENPMPQLQSSDNPLLDKVTLTNINWAIGRCFEINPKQRASTGELLKQFSSWAWSE